MNQDVNLLKYLATVDSSIGKLYDKLIKELAKIGASIADLDTEKLFSFSDYPKIKDKVEKILDKYTDSLEAKITNGMKDAIDMSYLANTTFLKDYSKLSDKALKTQRETAKNAFIRSRTKSEYGLGLSDRVWNYTQQAKAEFEAGMSEVIEDGIYTGISAEELGRRVRDKLKYPDMVYRRYHLKKLTKEGKKDVIEWRKKVVDKNGKVHFIKTEMDLVGRGVYRSSRKNALRLAATEINMAYRYADNVRWQSEPFIRGIRIRLSNNHTLNGKPFYDICDELQGDYPKSFMWSGWHPRCYSDDSYVLTDFGWKLFKDVKPNYRILSLNPENRNVEWVRIRKMMNWFSNEQMIRFYNRSIDCLITKEHEMIYLSKNKGEIKRCNADEYRKGKGGFYRGCEYDAEDVEYIELSGVKLDFDLYCEFMGYWLSDGSTIRSSQIVIAQQDGDKNKENIIRCIEKLGFEAHTNFSRVEFYFKPLCEYLKVFGTSSKKYVPSEIKQASKRQIRIFLNAYNSCDGTKKKPHSFINDRGRLFVPMNDELRYFTTSEQMSADLGELILKVGHRPSYNVDKSAGKKQKFKNGIYTINYDCYRITECRATTCTVFSKEYVDYTGYVYDLELERNHIMYIRRNGKCFWGSNCRCSASPILVPQEEMDEISNLPEEEYQNYRPKDLITTMPNKFKDWFDKNKERVTESISRGTQPYFIRDNKAIIDNLFNPKKRTPEQEQKLIDFWNEKQKRTEFLRKRADNVMRVYNERFGFNIPGFSDFENAIKYGDLNDIDLQTKNFAKNLSKVQRNIRKNALNQIELAKNVPEVDYSELETLLKGNNIGLIKDGRKKLEERMFDMIYAENELSDIIPDVKSWHKVFTINELKEVKSSILSTLNDFKSKGWGDFDSKTNLAHLKHSLEWQAEYMKNKGSLKYKTWEVAHKAYLKLVDKAQDLIDWDNIEKDLATLKAFKTSSKEFNNLLTQAIAYYSAGDKSKAQIYIYNAVVKKDQLAALKSKRAATKAAKAAGSSSSDAVMFGEKCFTEARRMAAKVFKSAMEAEYSELFDDASKLYKASSDGFKQAAEEYTKNAGYLTKWLRGINGFLERDYSYARLAERHTREMFNVIKKAELKQDMWLYRDERAAFLTLKAGGFDPNKLQYQIEEYTKKITNRYMAKGWTSAEKMKELQDKIDWFTDWRARQLIGRRGIDPSIISCGSNIKHQFSGTGGDNKYGIPKVRLEIYCPKGTQALYAAPFNHYNRLGEKGKYWNGESHTSKIVEAEVFLQRDTEFRIISARWDAKEDRWFVKVEVLGHHARDFEMESTPYGYKAKFK